MPSLVIAAQRLAASFRHCQRTDLIGDHASSSLIRGRLERGLGIRSGIKQMIRPAPDQPELGQPSRFAPGDAVRVLDRDAIRATLDDRDRTRGLWFTETQWDFTGKVLRVLRDVRRIRDDRGRYRAVSRTVLLDGADCGGLRDGNAGCGRHCPLMFRDEWLQPAEAPAEWPEPKILGWATVRPYEAIMAGLDLRNRRDGLTFMPEMRAYTGRRFPIEHEVDAVYELGRWIRTRAPFYELAGLRCGGTACTRGPCHRACRLVWHRDWLVLDAERVS